MPLPALTLLNSQGQPFSTHAVPKALVTGTGPDPKPRLRVDLAQTSFFEGREFRSYFDLNIPATTGITYFRFTSAVDFILFLQKLTLDSGVVKYETFIGATPAGTWTPIPVIGKNRMADRSVPLYATQVTVDTGGTFTGGTQVDLVRLAAKNTGNQLVSVGNTADDARGLPAGVYYGKISNTDNNPAVGVLSLAWEERQPASTII